MFIIDVCLALISTPTRGVVIRKNILARVSQSLPPLGGVVIRTEHTELLKRLYENGYIDLNGDPINQDRR